MIETVKIQGQGYLVNDIMLVPKDEGNTDYQAVQEWLKYNIAEPEFTVEELQAINTRAIKAKAEELITAEYPSYKQLNIIRLGGEDLIAMSLYIDSIRAISNEAELNGTSISDINWTQVIGV